MTDRQLHHTCNAPKPCPNALRPVDQVDDDVYDEDVDPIVRAKGRGTRTMERREETETVKPQDMGILPKVLLVPRNGAPGLNMSKGKGGLEKNRTKKTRNQAREVAADARDDDMGAIELRPVNTVADEL